MNKFINKKIAKSDWYALHQSSNIDDDRLSSLIEEHSYSNQSDWKKFLEYFILAIGSGLFLSGVIFFFAFNWNEIPRFGKFGMILLLLLVTVVLSVLTSVKEFVRKIALLSSSIVVGVLFAVFGQEYQTGANAYDLFLMWCIVIIPWTMVSKFTVQWLLFAVLTNTTLTLFYQQVVFKINPFYTIISYLVLNTLLFLLPYAIGKYQSFRPEKYYSNLMIFVCNSLAVGSLGVAIFTTRSNYSDGELSGLFVLFLLSIAWIGISFYISLKKKNILTFSYFVLAIAIIVFMVLIRCCDFSGGALLLYTLYVIGGTFGIIKLISNQQKEWNYERE